MRRLYIYILLVIFAPLSLIAQPISSINIAMFSDYIEKDANIESELISGAITKGRPFLKVPYNYRRTGTLGADISVIGLVALKKGAKGYWAGNNWATSTVVNGRTWGASRTNDRSDVWCFFGSNNFNSNHGLCIRNDSVSSTVVLSRYKPHLLSSFTTNNSQMYSQLIAIQEAPMKIFNNQIVEYRFDGWEDAGISVDIYVEGKFQAKQKFPFYSDGIVLAHTIDGSYSFAKTANGRGAMVTKISVQAP